MEVKKNDKYKKRFLLKQVESNWGYFECEGDIMLVKNCILKEKYNKIYQIIFHGGDAIDGLYLINAFDINVHYEPDDSRVFQITNKKYDKIAGYDGCTIHSFDNRDELIKWLLKEGFLVEEDLSLVNLKIIKKDTVKDLIRFHLDS